MLERFFEVRDALKQTMTDPRVTASVAKWPVQVNDAAPPLALGSRDTGEQVMDLVTAGNAAKR
jgi:hypothetical protein